MVLVYCNDVEYILCEEEGPRHYLRVHWLSALSCKRYDKCVSDTATFSGFPWLCQGPRKQGGADGVLAFPIISKIYLKPHKNCFSLGFYHV